MALLLFLLGPCVLAAILVISAGFVRSHPAATTRSLALVAAFGAAGALALSVGPPVELRASWVPSLGVDFSLRADAFRSLFVALICATATSIFLFTGKAYRNDPRLPGLLAGLLLFSCSMLGVVLADNIFLLFVFWEATSILSFVLIGWYHQKESARWKASQALLVTALGGLALLAGLVLLRFATGSSSLAVLTAADLSVHPLAPAIIVLVALGALTKSAQFPFHFWLPNAMAGPTPVSAYLHSATMVKAGVFLLAILAPSLSGHSLWTPLFVTCGFLTIVAAVWRGWRETDLKAILASTTLAALGHLTVLAGIGTPQALQAFVIFLIAHALYKAPLFLAAGVLEEAYGTRDISRLRGALYAFPLVGTAIAVSVLSLLGAPVLPGFLGKEYLLKSAWATAPWLAILAAASFAAVIALSVRAVAPLASRASMSAPNARPARGFQLTPWVSASLAILFTLGFPWLSGLLLTPAAGVLGGDALAPLKLWPGWSPILGLSLAALLLGVMAARWAKPPKTTGGGEPFFDALYRLLFEALGRAASSLAKFLQERTLQTHVAIVLAATGALVAVQLIVTGLPTPKMVLEASTAIPVVLSVLIALAGICAAIARSRLELITFLGLLGFMIALLYSFFSAPDLALTQLLTETILLVFLVAVLRKLPSSTTTGPRPLFAMPIAVLGGALVTAVVLKAKAIELTQPVSSFFTERSLTEAFGANVVNVILVDFRALDTLGEITVLGIAAIGAAALLRRSIPRHAFNPTATLLMRTALPILFVSLMVVTALFFLRGHNNPGGGFIAALIAATAFGFVVLSGAPSRFAKFDLPLILTGLGTAAFAGILAVATGQPFLTGLWSHPSLPGTDSSTHLGTPLLFDLGVFLTVLGFALAFLRRFLPPRSLNPSCN